VTGLQPGAVLISPSSLQTRGFKSLCVAQNFRTPQSLREICYRLILLKPALEVVQNEREGNNIVPRRRRPHS
jgi:hypothetical protein